MNNVLISGSPDLQFIQYCNDKCNDRAIHILTDRIKFDLLNQLNYKIKNMYLDTSFVLNAWSDRKFNKIIYFCSNIDLYDVLRDLIFISQRLSQSPGVPCTVIIHGLNSKFEKLITELFSIHNITPKFTNEIEL